MHNEVYIYRVTCPECGATRHGFIGDNEDGSFYCGATIEMKKGNKTWTDKCGCYFEKIRHLPDGSYEMIKTIKIEDLKLRGEI